MTPKHPAKSQVPPSPAHPLRLGICTMLRLGLYQLGLGMMSVLLFGLLNRVLIKELGVPGTVASLVLAVTLFVSPLRVWFGQLSDTRPLWGLHRTGYVVGGAVSFAVIAFIAVQPLWQMGLSLKAGNWAAALPWTILSTLLFGCYGIAVGASSTPFATLLVDVTDEQDRSRIAAIAWAMLLLGTIAGGVTIGVLLRQLGNSPSFEALQTSINRLFLVVPWGVAALSVIATWGVEKTYSRFLTRSQPVSNLSAKITPEDTSPEKISPEKILPEQISLKRAWKILTASRQTRFFFTFLLTMTLGLFLQDAILEPYGGDIFNMPPGETALLNAPYGVGAVAGILVGGFLIAPRFGKRQTVRWGCQGVAISLVAIMLAGLTQASPVLTVCLSLFGLASGVTTNGAIALMLDLTATETAGTFIGAWGLAQALARGLAVIIGGSTLDLGRQVLGALSQQLFGNPLLPYVLVFSLQIVGILVALQLLQQIDVREFQTAAKAAISQVLAQEMDL